MGVYVWAFILVFVIPIGGTIGAWYLLDWLIEGYKQKVVEDIRVKEMVSRGYGRREARMILRDLEARQRQEARRRNLLERQQTERVRALMRQGYLWEDACRLVEAGYDLPPSSGA